jgi:hypothetical protein
VHILAEDEVDHHGPCAGRSNGIDEPGEPRPRPGEGAKAGDGLVVDQNDCYRRISGVSETNCSE